MNIPHSKNARVRSEAGASNPPVKLTGYPIIDTDQAIQDRYLRFRAEGNSHNMAEMLAWRKPPGSQSDTDFQRGFGTLANQIGDPENLYLNEVTGNYKKITGHNPGDRQIYMPGLANFPGDPVAFVSSGSEAKRVAEQRNIGIREGSITNKPREPESDPFSTKSSVTGRNKVANDLKGLIRDAYKSKGSIVSDAALEAKHGNHTK